MAMVPGFAGAAGTYFNGNVYQNSYKQYGNGGAYNAYTTGRGYGQYNTIVHPDNDKTTDKKTDSERKKQGFVFDVNAAHEFASWDFEMKEAGSQLHYDGLRWNVVGAEGAYYFDTSVPVQIKMGARYGKQFGESTMVDDDISNGPYAYQYVLDDRIVGYALSVGTSTGGTQMGFNAAFGLTDFFKVGKVKITPSIGYRYFKHEVITKNNSAMEMDILENSYNCSSDSSMTKCDFVGIGSFYDVNGDMIYVTDTDGSSVPSYFIITSGDYDLTQFAIPADSVYLNVDFGDTRYYNLKGTSHKYETEWAGPYAALDIEYDINEKNFVTAGIEYGLPIYDSKGDQPYRTDWAHPTSVEDKGGFGDAYHLGLNGNWATRVSKSMYLTFGFTYDYYNVKGADAKTFYNAAEKQADLDELEAYEAVDGLTEVGKVILEDLRQLKANGWVAESKNEVDSVYKSMGIRIGLDVKF
jgi:hypothetical protein